MPGAGEAEPQLKSMLVSSRTNVGLPKSDGLLKYSPVQFVITSGVGLGTVGVASPMTWKMAEACKLPSRLRATTVVTAGPA